MILKSPICPKSRWFYRQRISNSPTDVGRLVLASAERAAIQFRQKTSNPLLCGRSNYSGLREIRLDISQTVIVKCLRGSSRKRNNGRFLNRRGILVQIGMGVSVVVGSSNTIAGVGFD